MESLALLVAALLLTLLLSALLALLVSVRARTRRAHVVAVILGIPAGFVGCMLLLNVGSSGGRMFGLVGLSALVIPSYRLWRAASIPHPSE